jgi:hypothetical protein
MISDIGVSPERRLPQIDRHDARNWAPSGLGKYRQPDALAAELRLQQAAVAARRDVSCGEEPLHPLRVCISANVSSQARAPPPVKVITASDGASTA